MGYIILDRGCVIYTLCFVGEGGDKLGRRILGFLLIALILITICIPNYAFASTTLRDGSRGAEVTRLQQRLIELGYLSGKADGIFGSVTQRAVIDFQKNNGLVVDGIVGPKTWALLYSDKAKAAGTASAQPPSWILIRNVWHFQGMRCSASLTPAIIPPG
jgi:hypothetical protein